jgi:rod shape-determining protein MreC
MRDPESDSRRGNPVLLVLLVVASLLLTTAYFREGDGGILHAARQATISATAPLVTAGTAIASPFRAVGEWAEGLGASREEIEALREQNEELRDRLAELEEARMENERLRALVDFVEESDFDVVGAGVIGLPTNSWDASILIDRGSDAGIEEGMPVIAAQGLVGQVVEASERAAKIRLITDQRSGTAVIIQSTRAPGVARGTLEGVLQVDYVDEEQAPEPGDVVLTSGMGGVFPKGIVVGDVTEVEQERHRLFPTITVESRVPVTEIEEVLVILGPLPTPDLGAGE